MIVSNPDAKPARSRYRKVEVRTWGDEKFRALSPMPPSGQGLWLFLITGPHTGPIPGLFRAGRAAMAEELGWEQEAFDKAFREVFQQGMAKADFKARVVWVPNAFKHNRPESPNVVRGWAAEFDLIPECDLKWEALEALRASVYAVGEAFAKAFDEAFGKASAKPSPKTSPNQEQEQEQEQEKAIPPDGGGEVGKPTPPPADLAKRQQERLREVTEDARQAFNATLGKPNGLLASVRLLTEVRMREVKRCLSVARLICQEQYGSERITPQFWADYFAVAAADDFCAGRVPGGPGHEGWQPDFEYLTRPAVMAKLFDRALADEPQAGVA